MVTVDRIREFRDIAESEINRIIMQLEKDTGLKVTELKYSFFAERKKGDKFGIMINFESI